MTTPMSEPEKDLWKALIESVLDATSIFERQKAVGPYEIDIALEQRVAIEVLGHSFHCGKDQFEKDAKRTRYLYGKGYGYLPFTAKQVAADPGGCALEIANLHGLEIIERKISDEQKIIDVYERSEGLLTAKEVNDLSCHEAHAPVNIFGKIKREVRLNEKSGVYYADLLCIDEEVALQIFGRKMQELANLIKKDSLIQVTGLPWYADRRQEWCIKVTGAIDGNRIIEGLNSSEA